MNQQQYNEAKRIIDDAHDGATHYDCHSGGYARIVGDIQFELEFGKWKPTWPECQDVYVTRSLSDLKMLVEMYEREQELKAAMQTFVERCDKGEVRSSRTYNQFKALLTPPEDKDNDNTN